MIKTVKESGFCYGVKAAIKKADEQYTKIQDGKKIYLLGDLVNNAHVMDGYHAKGYIVTDDVDEIEAGSTVVVRAHGVPKAVIDVLMSKDIVIVDCTCINVKKVHDIVMRCTPDVHVVIIGKKGHPEVVGTEGWVHACHNTHSNNYSVCSSDADLALIPFDKPLCVVAQTTCSPSFWAQAQAFILNRQPSAVIHNTPCNVTNNRMENAVQLAKQSDVMVVVGDEKSANSLELYHAVKDLCKTFFVSSLAELIASDTAKETLDVGANISVAGSASAPNDIIDDIYGYLSFSNFLAIAKQEIEAGMDQYLESFGKNIHQNHFLIDALDALNTQNKNGKRIRGAMIKLGAQIAENLINKTQKNQNNKNNHEHADEKNANASYLFVAMAYELFQTAILIHDDIIDQSPTRRGRKTIHNEAALQKEHCGFERPVAKHFGTAKAICVGDYGLFLANKIFAEARLEPDVFIKAFQLFNKIQLTTLEGEIMDVTLPYEPINIANDYEYYTAIVNSIFEYKTAWYTLVGPIMLGAILAGAPDDVLKQLHDITMPLGIAFQTKDDLLGIYADEKTLGKSTLSDLIEKKQTLLYGYAYQFANSAQRKCLDAAYGKADANYEDLRIVQDIFEQTGARAHAESEIKRLSALSMDHIHALDAPDEDKALLIGLVNYLITRTF